MAFGVTDAVKKGEIGRIPEEVIKTVPDVLGTPAAMAYKAATGKDPRRKKKKGYSFYSGNKASPWENW
jgi:hypothetical protein